MQGSSVAEGPGAAPVKYCDKMDVAEGWLPFRLDTESRLVVNSFSRFLNACLSWTLNPEGVVHATWDQGQYLQFSSRLKLLCE
jgi:hypothetical protein